MPARARHTETLKEMGFDGEMEEFRSTLAAVKAELYPDMTDEDLTYTRDEAGAFCAEVRKRLKVPRLSRVFLLRALIGLRKHRKVRRKEVAGTGA